MKKIVIYCFLFFITFSCLAVSQHPRLLFDEDDIEDIQDKIDTYDCLSDYFEDLRDDAYGKRTTDFYNKRIEMHYGSDMALVYLVDTDYPYRNELKDTAIAALTEMYDTALALLPDDGWPDPLTIPSALLHMSLIYDMLYDEMTFAERRQTATQIKTVVDSMLNWEWGGLKLGKIVYGNNCSMHQAAGIGIGIIAIKGDSLNDQTIFTEAMATPYIDSVNAWMEILDEGVFDTTGCNFEGAGYGVFGTEPMVGYYEMLKRDDNTDLFQNSNLKKLHEWLISELIPAEARKSGIDSSLFDFNPINSSFNWKNTYLDHYCAPSVTVVPLAAALGGIYQNEPTAGAATWLFERHLNILLNYTFEKAPANQFGTSNILAITKYADNAEHPDDIEEFPKTKFFSGRGLIVRDGYATDGTLFSFETNHAHNPETGGLFCRHDEDDNNSFTFFAYGRRWAIDCAKNSEYSKFHNTVLIDGYHQPHRESTPYNAADIQVTNWYDYHNKNNSYYIISDITDAWVKKKHHSNPICATCGGGTPYCDGTGIDYFYDEHIGYFPSWADSFSTSNRYRRHAQFIQKEGDLPPYIIIHDDIDLDDSEHDYTFLLHTGPGNTVGSFDQDSNKVRITSSDCIMDVYMKSVDESIEFSTDNDDGLSWAVDPHKRLKFTANAVNPRFHAVLVPSGSSESAVSNLTYTNLNDSGSVATIEFFAGSQDVTDYSLFSYQKSLDYQGFALEGCVEPNPDSVSGIMGYCRLDETTDEITNIFLSRGSYLKMDSTELINIGGRTARVILNDDEIDIYKVNPSTGRYSYKIYGKDVTHFKINDETHSYQKFNDYTYVKSDILIPDYYALAVDPNEVKVNWYCSEQHDMKIHYWDSADPDSIYTKAYTDKNSGNNFANITLDTEEDWIFRLEGTMQTDGFIDLTDTMGISTIPEDLVLQDITVKMDSTKTYQALRSITAAGESTYFVIQGNGSTGGDVTMFTSTAFTGNYISLLPGFEAQEGCTFDAYIKNPVQQSSYNLTAPITLPYGPEIVIEDENESTEDAKKNPIPTVFSCAQNKPNPFARSTIINYGLPKDSDVNLTVFNIAGQAVRTLVNANQSAGFRSVNWDGSNNAGAQMPQGTYFYVFKAGDFEEHKKMILLK